MSATRAGAFAGASLTFACRLLIEIPAIGMCQQQQGPPLRPSVAPLHPQASQSRRHTHNDRRQEHEHRVRLAHVTATK